jgi:hypothetical protein
VLPEAGGADSPGLDPADLPVGDAQAAGDCLVGIEPDDQRLDLQNFLQTSILYHHNLTGTLMPKHPMSAKPTSSTDADFRRQESRLRRRLRRQGYILCKSRTRNERHISYGGYLITDENRNVVGGCLNYTMNIDDVERFANEPD